MNSIEEKLTVAISYNAVSLALLNADCETRIKNVLDEATRQPAPVARAQHLVEASAQINMRPLSERLHVNQLLTDLMALSLSGKTPEYEFYTDRESYKGENDVSLPVDKSKLDGVVGILVATLTACGIATQWPPRENGLKAKFIITG